MKKIILIIVLVLIGLVFLFIFYWRGGFVGFNDLQVVGLSINKKFPNPPCKSCVLGVKPTNEFDNLRSRSNSCRSNEDCAAVMYDGNPLTSCGPTVVPINNKGKESVQSEMGKYFVAYEAQRPQGVCGLSFYNPVGVTCEHSQCEVVYRDLNGRVFLKLP